MTEVDNDNKSELLDRLDKAHQFRKWGGLMPYLMNTVSGFRAFVVENLIETNMPAQKFISKMVDKFPDISLDLIPSRRAVDDFKNKLKQSREDDLALPPNLSVKLKDELEAAKWLQDFNFFRERVLQIDRTDKMFYVAGSALRAGMTILRKTKIPPDFLFKALASYAEALNTRSKMLDELDDLCVRFGFMPPKEKNNIFVLQQNWLKSKQEGQEVVRELGLTAKDFLDENFPATCKKISEYELRKMGKSQ